MNNSEKTTKRAPNIRGIVKASSALGCTRQHLQLVLKGERTSPDLFRRYAALPKTFVSLDALRAKVMRATPAELKAAGFPVPKPSPKKS